MTSEAAGVSPAAANFVALESVRAACSRDRGRPGQRREARHLRPEVRQQDAMSGRAVLDAEQVGRPAAYCGGMGEIVVVYELDNPMAKRSSLGIAAGEQRPVRKLHAAPSAPGEPSATGPRTLCGKDTFAMQTACWKPSHPGAPWYPVQYASVVCSDCDAVIET